MDRGPLDRHQRCARHRALLLAALVAPDATETSADELQSRAEDFRDRLDELQEVATGERIDTALSNLETSLDSARDTAAQAGDKADERVAQAEDSLQEVNQKWARLQVLVTDVCNQQ